MDDVLITLVAVAIAVGLAMAFVSWRINRIQYPPELRWPSQRKRRRRKPGADDHSD